MGKCAVSRKALYSCKGLLLRTYATRERLKQLGKKSVACLRKTDYP